MENSLEPASNLMVVTSQAVSDLKSQRTLLKRFVQSQLVEANFTDKTAKNYGEGDFGIIPGTPKRCLFKPGAEKLLRLFNLGARFSLVDKEFDLSSNFAMYTYKCEIYTLRGNVTVAECIATANSQEEKYREKTKWRTNEKGVREQTKIETPIADVINTLQKMAQKRALVGATILATGASEYFTQDVLDEDSAPEVHVAPKEQPRDVTPQPQAAEPKQEPQGPPVCCGKEMLLSKYVDREMGHKPWYCLNCRKKVAADGVA